jgi:hypothetical protein
MKYINVSIFLAFIWLTFKVNYIWIIILLRLVSLSHNKYPPQEHCLCWTLLLNPTVTPSNPQSYTLNLKYEKTLLRKIYKDSWFYFLLFKAEIHWNIVSKLGSHLIERHRVYTVNRLNLCKELIILKKYTKHMHTLWQHNKVDTRTTLDIVSRDFVCAQNCNAQISNWLTLTFWAMWWQYRKDYQKSFVPLFPENADTVEYMRF